MLREISRTTSGKFYLGVWGLSVCVVVAFSLAGLLLMGGEIAGGILMSVLIAGMLTIISIIISFWAGEKSHSLARLTWLVLTVLALSSALILLKSGQKDADIALTYEMLVLTFPAGFIVGPIVGSALSWNSSSSVFIYCKKDGVRSFIITFDVHTKRRTSCTSCTSTSRGQVFYCYI